MTFMRIKWKGNGLNVRIYIPQEKNICITLLHLHECMLQLVHVHKCMRTIVETKQNNSFFKHYTLSTCSF